jgi:hypothetical protein
LVLSTYSSDSPDDDQNHNELSLSSIQESDNSMERKEIEAKAYLQVDRLNQVTSLISPTDGKIIKIKGLTNKISTSADALGDLKHIEE